MIMTPARTVLLCLLLLATSVLCVLPDGPFSMDVDPWLVNATTPERARKQARAQRASEVKATLRRLASLLCLMATIAKYRFLHLALDVRETCMRLGINPQVGRKTAVLCASALSVCLAVYLYIVKRRRDLRARQLAHASTVYELFDELMGPCYDASFWEEHSYMAAPRRKDFPAPYKEPTTLWEKLAVLAQRARVLLLGEQPHIPPDYILALTPPRSSYSAVALLVISVDVLRTQLSQSIFKLYIWRILQLVMRASWPFYSPHISHLRTVLVFAAHTLSVFPDLGNSHNPPTLYLNTSCSFLPRGPIAKGNPSLASARYLTSRRTSRRLTG